MTCAAIIPAYNEEKTICDVIRAFKDAAVDEIIVIDDGSIDHTATQARGCDVRVIAQENSGKGAAMQRGVKETTADILFFADADLVNFTATHVRAVLDPIASGCAEMAIGLRDKNFLTHLAPAIAPVLGGERALKRDLFLAMMDEATEAVGDFGIETVMNAYCKSRDLRVQYVDMPRVTHVIKEIKYGFLKGIVARIRMVIQILRAEFVTMRK